MQDRAAGADDVAVKAGGGVVVGRHAAVLVGLVSAFLFGFLWVSFSLDLI